MTSVLAVWLASVGLADLVADLSGHPSSRARSIAGGAAGVVGAVGGGLVLGHRIGTSLLLALVVAVTLGGWLGFRVARGWSRRRGILTFWWLAVSLTLVVATLGRWPVPAESLFGRWLGDVPLVLTTGPPEEAAVVLGWLLFLAATSNGIVRVVLASIERDVPSGAEPLKGGRIIGPMERWLIFGLVLADASTAAGLVVGAKGLIRYAEIRGAEIEWKTEYLLVGSLTSWLLALLPVLLIR